MDRKEFIENIEYLQLPELTSKVALEAFERRTKYYLDLAARAYEGVYSTFPIRHVRPLDRIVTWVVLLTEVRQRYIDKGIPEDVIQATFDDVALLAGIYEKNHGRPGLTQIDAGWFRHMYNCHIFKLGAMQFQLDKMSYPARMPLIDPEQLNKLPAGTPTIAMHIQEGTDMSEDAITNSINLANEFFPRYFPDYQPKVYTASSWLLYPGLQELLPPNSKILSFAARFTLVSSIQDPYGSDSVKIIFGKRYKRKSDYPQNTSLQRKALHNFSKLGISMGTIEFP